MPSTMATAINITTKSKNKKIIFDDDGEVLAAGTANEMPPTAPAKKVKGKKTIFEDADETLNESIKSESETLKTENDDAEEEDYFAKREKQRQQQSDDKDSDARKKWFNVYPQYPSTEDVLDIKESEQTELYNLCKSSFEAELPMFNKRNASDARWLQTALRKGTAKDRANAGALLVTSNPLGNLDALSTLTTFTKISNKSSNDVVIILTDLWKQVLLPPQRKLLSLEMRGADWKLVRKDTTLGKEKQRRIYAYWYFEHELKDQYFEFLKNLQYGLQTGQEHNKNSSIVAAAQLLAFAPEKEQMLLTMLINKLGDPTAKVASKALHHLSEVAHRHPNMCGVIVTESEKLLFRNNISERAQHFSLCFLASIAPAGRPDVCNKLVHICFSLFKVLVQKGAINNRTMQAILRCLQKAILEAKPAVGSTEILSKDMQDTVYRLVHLADIRVSVQTLGLLLQLITVKTEKSDRFYNALYKKILDLEVTSIGVKTAAQLLHIVHRAIHIDTNVQRAQAFIKRLLQIALYMPSHMTAGCLIVIHKLLRSRKELLDDATIKADKDNKTGDSTSVLHKVTAEDEELDKFDSEGEEKYEDIREAEDDDTANVITEPDTADDTETKVAVNSSWHHVKLEPTANEMNKVRDIAPDKYDPYHRVPSFAGAEYALRNELVLLSEHYHPTVQVFAANILQQKRIDYYGDPLRDFSLPHFLERFAFKNPKKLDNQLGEAPIISHKRYVAFGTRGKSVKSLTKANCTEDEMYIFNFLEHKRQQLAIVNKAKKKGKTDIDEEDDLKFNEVDDEEFDNYLDGFFGKKAKAAADAEAEAEDDDAELDFLKELGGELKSDKKKQKKKKKSATEDDDELEDIDADWGDDDEVEAGNFDVEGDDLSDDAEGSIGDTDNDDDDDGGSISLDDEAPGDESDEEMSNASEGSMSAASSGSEDDDDDDNLRPPKSKKSRKQATDLDGRSFAKKLKHSDDMSSLFAAADDFAELLEETGKTKGQGTANAVFNKDKSSAKQLKWEEKRHSNAKTYTKRGGGGANKFSKKRKH